MLKNLSIELESAFSSDQTREDDRNARPRARDAEVSKSKPPDPDEKSGHRKGEKDVRVFLIASRVFVDFDPLFSPDPNPESEEQKREWDVPPIEPAFEHGAWRTPKSPSA
jgi:hypothetical protein